MALELVPGKVYRPEDLLLLSEGQRFELSDGELVERHMGAIAGMVEATLLTLLTSFVRSNRLGVTFGSSTGYQIFGEQRQSVRFPDGSFIRMGRLPNDRPPGGHHRIAPDLAIEVISPNDLAEEVEEKIEEYLQAGVWLIWVVFANTQRIMVYRRNTVTRLTPTDELSGEDVVPGFSCRVEEVFAGL